MNKNKEPLHPEIIHFLKAVPSTENPKAEYVIECALQYTDGYQETVFTFVTSTLPFSTSSASTTNVLLSNSSASTNA